MTQELPRFSMPVLSSELIASNQVLLRLDARDTAFGSTHKRAGQYAFLHLPGEARAKPFVLASLPGAEEPEILVKASGAPEVESLRGLVGAEVELSAAEGHGYPLHKAEGRPLHLFAVGSAIAALRPVIESVLLVRDRYGPVHLYYGVQQPEDFAFAQDFPRWQQGLTSVTLVVSRPEGTSWEGEVGYVTDHLPDVLEDAERAVAFVCGLPEMEQDVYTALEVRGVLEDRVFRNYG